MQSGQYLLVIDNLESLLQPDGQWQSQLYEKFFQAWLEHSSQSTVLVTTRERPILRGFEWLPLKGLKIPDGVALLAELGIRGDLEAFTELVDGHPLLLKLVADLLKDEYAQDPCLERLTDLGLRNLQQLLTDPKMVGSHRRKNVGMYLVLDASFERLSASQKTLLQKVSVYRGAFYRAAVAALLSAGAETELEGELRKLVKRSLLQEKLNGKWQFEFQPVVLEYVRHKTGDQTEAHQQAITYYRSIAKEQPWQTIDDIKEYLEIFYHYYQLGDYDSAINTVWTCDDFLTLRGYYTVSVEVYGQLVKVWKRTGEKENWNYSAALICLGNAYNSLGDYQQAIEFLQQSLAIAPDISERNVEVCSLNGLGIAYKSLGDYPQAIEFLQQSLAIARDISDRKGEAMPLVNLGRAYYFLGQYPQAIDFHQQSLAIAQQIGDPYREAISLGNLGDAYNSLGEYQQATECNQQRLEIAREIGSRREEAGSLIGLGNTYDSLGQYQQAIDLFQQSLAIKRDIGDRNGEANSWFNLGLALENVNRESDAIGAYRNARKLYQAMGLDTDAQDCDREIERLSQPQVPTTPRRGLWQWLSRLWRWLKKLWQ